MPRRKRSAWGTLTRVDSQTWRLRFWATGPDGQYKRRSKTIRGSRLDAERVRSELMLAHSEDAPCPTVGEVWEQYALPDLRRRVDGGDLKRNSLDQYSRGYGKHVEPVWGDVQCDAVRPLAIQQWLYGMGSSGAQQGIQHLRLVLDYAVRYELVQHNVARENYIMPSKQTIERRDDGIWTLDELADVWHWAALGTWWEAAFLMAAFGGLRVSESLGVRADDVSVALVGTERVTIINVERQSDSKGGTDDPKTPQSKRVAVMCGRAGARVAELAQQCNVYLSGDGMGGPSTRWRLTKAWGNAPLSVRHPFKNLRPSWQTWMRWDLHVPPMYIKPMMGHKIPDVTGLHYDRPVAQMFAEVLADAYESHRFDATWTWAN